jgi:hypothetical protein
MAGESGRSYALSRVFGGDPELFVVNKKSGKIVSSHRFLDRKAEGKANAHNGNFDFGGGKVKRDGVAIEIELGPSYCRDWVVPKTFYFLAQTLKAANEAGFNNVKLSGSPVAELTQASLKDAPEDCLILGCNPDYSAYSFGEKAPVLDENDNRRYTGGHIHFDFTGRNAEVPSEKHWNKLNKEDRVELGAAATVVYDYLIGLPSVAVLGNVHGNREAERRVKYGQAGSYRIPNHGVEYRVLSGNGFILHPVLVTLWVGIGRKYNGWSLDMLTKQINILKDCLPIDDMRQIIDNHDYSTAWRFILDGYWDKMLSRVMPRPTMSEDSVLKTIVRAAQDNVSWSSDIGFNWGATYYPKFKALSHNYWGVEGAASGGLDEAIYPQRSYDTRLEKSRIQWYHPSVEKWAGNQERGW